MLINLIYFSFTICYMRCTQLTCRHVSALQEQNTIQDRTIIRAGTWTARRLCSRLLAFRNASIILSQPNLT